MSNKQRFSERKAYSLVDPKIDIVFKRIFSSIEHPSPLLDLTNAIIEPFSESAITELKVLNPAIDPEYVHDKSTILDIKAKTASRELINIEMQMVNQYDWEQRSLYYWSRLFNEQLSKGRIIVN